MSGLFLAPESEYPICAPRRNTRDLALRNQPQGSQGRSYRVQVPGKKNGPQLIPPDQGGGKKGASSNERYKVVLYQMIWRCCSGSRRYREEGGGGEVQRTRMIREGGKMRDRRRPFRTTKTFLAGEGMSRRFAALRGMVGKRHGGIPLEREKRASNNVRGPESPTRLG